MSNLFDLALFGIFLVIVAVVRRSRTGVIRRRAVTALILYITAVLAGLAAARRDAWPFATHGAFLEASDARRPFTNVRFVAVDASGREHLLDQRSWAPISVRTLDVWWLVNYRRLRAEQQREVMAFLLDKAENARSSRPTVLRHVASPPWYSADPAAPPSNAEFVALRAYLVTRTPAEKLARGVESSTLGAEFHR